MTKDELFYGKYAAEYYDKLMSGEGEAGYLHTKDSYKKSAKILFEHLRKYNPNGKRLLEVGCGTGNFCVEFAKLGLKVKGTDYSNDLLKSAKTKTHRNIINYEFADMRDFEEKEPFDYLVCLFDTFRYNQSYKEVKQTLNCFYNSINKGGVLILDAHYTNPVVKERSVELPKIELSNGTTIQETVYGYTKGCQDIKRSVQKVYKKGKFIKNFNVKRLPRIRISHLKMKIFLQESGFHKIRILKGYDNKGKKEKIVVIAVKK